MGQNSTEVAYSFGQFGSTYLTGDGGKLDLVFLITCVFELIGTGVGTC